MQCCVRRYAQEKIQENVEAEIFQVVLDEMREHFGQAQVLCRCCSFSVRFVISLSRDFVLFYPMSNVFGCVLGLCCFGIAPYAFSLTSTDRMAQVLELTSNSTDDEIGCEPTT